MCTLLRMRASARTLASITDAFGCNLSLCTRLSTFGGYTEGFGTRERNQHMHPPFPAHEFLQHRKCFPVLVFD